MCDDRISSTKVLGYVRVSSRGQALDGLSLGVQRAAVEAFAAREGLDLVGIVEDGGRSGESLRRKGIREVFARLDSGEVAGVVVPKLDRLTRSVKDWSGLVEDRFGPDGGQRLYSAGEPLDLATAYGRLFACLVVAFSECELDTGAAPVGDRHRRQAPQGGACRQHALRHEARGRR